MLSRKFDGSDRWHDSDPGASSVSQPLVFRVGAPLSGEQAGLGGDQGSMQAMILTAPPQLLQVSISNEATDWRALVATFLGVCFSLCEVFGFSRRWGCFCAANDLPGQARVDQTVSVHAFGPALDF